MSQMEYSELLAAALRYRQDLEREVKDYGRVC
jgi:hypothetical protein